MKPYYRLIAAILAIALLCGCAKFFPEPKQPEAEPSQPASEPAPAPAPSEPEQPLPEEQAEVPAAEELEQPASEGEPEVWEEEWPEEYVVDSYCLEDGAITQTGDLNKYRYTQLDGAERYMDIIALYVQHFLGDSISMKEDSPHDGYANWFYSGEGGTASVSGSSITGRFSYGLYLDFDRILEMTEAQITDPAAMEQAAWDFVGRFSDITGELELVDAAADTENHHDARSDELKDVSVPVMVYTFRSKQYSRMTLDIQDGTPAPVACGDSTVADPNDHCFNVTVWPDGTVTSADNYVSRAGVTADGTARMLTESDLPRLLNFFTSTTEHDTVVFESIRADHFDVYFGSASVDPTMTVVYHFESDPDEPFSTEFVLPGLFDPT